MSDRFCFLLWRYRRLCIYSAFGVASPDGSVTPSAFAFFFLLFLFSRKFLASSAFSSSSSSSFSVFTSSGLYQVGGWVINEGPPGSRAIVKWKAATNVLAGVYLPRPG